MGKFGKSVAGVFLMSVGLTGCAMTVDPPHWPTVNPSASVPGADNVTRYIDAYNATYRSRISEFNNARGLFESGTILSALVGATGLALGAGVDFGIVLGAIGSANSLGSNQVQPRPRMLLYSQAMVANACIMREYYQQKDNIGRAETAGMMDFLSTTSLGRMAREDVVERIAIRAADTVALNLQSRVISTGSVPNYATITTNLQQLYAQARTSAAGGGSPTAKTMLEELDEELIEDISEYEARVTECVAQVPPAS